jgi:rubrerythrin
MRLNTASEIIKFAVKLEEDSAKFYEELARRYAEGEELFRAFAKENRKNKISVERAYYEVVSDALETGFSFEGLDADEYSIETGPTEGRGYAELLRIALGMEERIRRFYLTAAERSRSLMADVPRVFARVAKRREERKRKLKALLEEK